ncbi:MAG: hypothetical protein AB4041_02345 [Microcystaceae cyanobacterium]
MTDSQTPPEFNPLSKLVSLIALVAAGLYFTGWIYRWAYFGFFHLQVTSLNLPLESFYLAAFQALFGSSLTVLRTIFGFIITLILILGSLKLLQFCQGKLSRLFNQYFPNRNSNHLTSLKFLLSLFDELIIISCLLFLLFLLAQWKGEQDAWLDAVNDTSTLPIITVIVPESSSLGRKFDNPLDNEYSPTLRIIGDRELYNNIRGKELTRKENTQQKRVWRLLTQGNGYFYIFPALPEKNKKLDFPIIKLYERDNGVQLQILSR